MKLSIVIVSYNAPDYLYACLKSVEKALKIYPADVWLVDNNSSEDIASVAQEFEWLNTIYSADNLGFSSGNNLAIDQIKTDYVLLLNPDTIVGENCFLEAMSFAEKQKNLGALSCQLIDINGNFHPESKRNTPHPLGSLLKILKADKLFKIKGLDYYANHIDKDQTAKTEILSGAFMLMKTKEYRAVGGLDNDYFMYGEDIDLSYKLLQEKLDIWYLGGLKVIHFKGESTVKNNLYIQRFYGAMLIFLEKHFKNKYPRFLFWMMKFFIRFKIKIEQIKLLKTKKNSPTKTNEINYTTLDSLPKNIQNPNLIFKINALNIEEFINFISVQAKPKNYLIDLDKEYALGSAKTLKIK